MQDSLVIPFDRSMICCRGSPHACFAGCSSYWIGWGRDKQHTSKLEPGICGFYSVTTGYLPNATVAHEVGLHLADHLRGMVERRDFVMLPLHNATPLRNKRSFSRSVEPICRVKREQSQASSELLFCSPLFCLRGDESDGFPILSGNNPSKQRTGIAVRSRV